MGVPFLCILISPLISGVHEFKFMYFHWLFLSIICVHSFRVLLTCFWNFVVRLSWVSVASLLEMKFFTSCSYSSQCIITIELPSSAFATVALFFCSLSLI